MIPGNLGMIIFYSYAIIRLSKPLPYIIILRCDISNFISIIYMPKPNPFCPFWQLDAINFRSTFSYNYVIVILNSPFCLRVNPILRSRCPSNVKFTFLAWIFNVCVSFTVTMLPFQLIIIFWCKLDKLYLALTPPIVV